MHQTLLFVLLIVLLLEPAATTNPAFAAALSLAPMELDHPAPAGILICEPCSMPREYCCCAVDPHNPHEWPFPENSPEPQPQLRPAPRPELLPEPTTNAEPLFLRRFNLERFEENATTVSVSRSTMEIHLEGIYALGDRIAQQSKRKRHASRTGGFPCSFASCDKSFNRQCEATRHEKIHANPSERPHKCDECEQAFWYPKDLERHQKTHRPPVVLYCYHPDCRNHKGFSRRDNLRRHQRKHR